MAKTLYAYDELMAEHDYASPHKEAGFLLHGGFDEKGTYISPRTRHRSAALEAWEAALLKRGGKALDASRALLARGVYPNHEQQRLLLAEGFGKTFWNSLTITGVIEARGRALVDYPAPKMQDLFEEDISHMCVGHLEKGLLVAHGMDEGGDPSSAIGAHDKMWFAVRDMVFGKGAYPKPEVPENIGRPGDEPFFADIPNDYDTLLTLLMDVLMVEVRALAFFEFCVQILRDPQSFPEKPAEKEQAAILVDRIRQDEMVHIGYLRLAISEMRELTFRGVSGKTLSGKKIIDGVWKDMVLWHGETQFDLARQRTRDALKEELPPELFARLDALDSTKSRGTKSRAA